MIWAYVDGKLLSPDEVEKRVSSLALKDSVQEWADYSYSYSFSVPTLRDPRAMCSCGKELFDDGLCEDCLCKRDFIEDWERPRFLQAYRELLEEEKAAQEAQHLPAEGQRIWVCEGVKE